MKYLSIILLVLATSVCSAQTISTGPGCAIYAKGEKHLPNVPACKQAVKPALPVANPETKAIYPEDYPWGFSGIVTIQKYATTTEKLTADGHYIFTVDDPNNEYRCYGTMNNSTITITCVIPHEVVKDR